MTNQTDKVLYGMLTENTGTHFLDSGGAYGRHWQANQGSTLQGWIDGPSATLNRYGDYTKSVFHYLRDRVEYAQREDKIWYDYWHLERFNDSNWIAISEEFVEELGAFGMYKREGKPFWTNTYNSEDALSQTLQFLTFSLPFDRKIKVKGYRTFHEGEYVLLQIHGGADVRGGYTAPRVFSCESDALFDNAHGSIECMGAKPDVPSNQLTIDATPVPTPARHVFDTDNAGYTWNLDGIWGYGSTTIVLGNNEYEVKKGALAARYDEDLEKWLCPLCEAPLEAVWW